MREEKELQTKILNDIRSMPEAECFKVKSSGDTAFPDIFFTHEKTGACFIEVKKPGEEPTRKQYAKLSKLRRCGCIAFWLSSWPEWVIIKKDLGIYKQTGENG